jgi:hypothetical protein
LLTDDKIKRTAPTKERPMPTAPKINGLTLIPAALPPGVERMTVRLTGTLSTELLNANTDNRRLDQTLAKTYSRQMLSPEGWPYIGDPIRIDKNGKFLDGQHRARAVELACQTNPHFFLVVDLITGLEPETRANMDVGRRRSPSDEIHMRGIRNSGTCSSAARLLMRWSGHSILPDSFTPASPEIVRFVWENQDRLERSAGIGYAAHVQMYAKPSVATAFHYRAAMVDPIRADEFFHFLRTGEDMRAGNPILTFRNKIIRQRTESLREDQNEQLYHFCTAWRDWTQRRTNYKFMPPRSGFSMDTPYKVNDTILLEDGKVWEPK